ncbi:MAG: Crp/Fnr family transcriptional regulator, partial [Lachnospiraceae bacterium]|nr:Crp/Fnr family transcriptional regulator [Lachnospiraceae bacterium]
MPGRNRLAQSRFFKELPKETLDFRWREGCVREFSNGSVLSHAGEIPVSVYIQLTGKSMIYNLTHAGRRKILFIFGSGVLLNEHVENVKASSCYCEMINKSKVLVISSAKFLQRMEKDFQLAKAVLVIQEWKMWRLCHQLKNTLGGIGLERKLAAKLWKLSRDFGVEREDGIEIDVDMSITFLADMLGTPRETASRLCTMLLNYGLIQRKKKRIIITNPKGMATFYKTGKIEEPQ